MEAARAIDAAERRDRNTLHEEALGFVTRELRRRGCRVVRLEPPSVDDSGQRQRGVGPTILRVTNRRGAELDVIVRGARSTVVRKSFQKGGARYAGYHYSAHKWNLHVHGERRHHPDVWVLVPEERPDGALVIPDAELRGAKVVELLVDPKRPRLSSRRQFEGAWDVVVDRPAPVIAEGW